MKTLFERMSDLARQRAEEAEAIRKARPGDVIKPAPRKQDIRPAFTGAGSPSFKPARHGSRPPGK